MNISSGKTVFGTDGIRGRLGSALFTQQQLCNLAHAISAWLKKRSAQSATRPRILILHDTRNSSGYIKSLFKMVFLSQTIDIDDAGVLPTPAADFLIKKKGYDCALIISASHNPWYDNGIKIIDRTGKLDAAAEKMIASHLDDLQQSVDYINFGNEYMLHGTDEYRAIIASFFQPNFLQGLKIVLDCAHGATSAVAPALFQNCGAQVITLHNQPNGFNINDACGSLYPEKLRTAVLEQQADFGFAFDGDGDRVLAVNRMGELKNGDDFLALLSTHPDYSKERIIVGTTMTNVGLGAWLAQAGKKLVRTPVGDKYVAQGLEEYQAFLGGEQSGHIILKNHTHTGDGILVALKSIEAALLTNNTNFNTFVPFPQVLLTIPVKKMCNLSENPYLQLIEYAQQLIPSGRISVRYSGTEKNMLRIMVESDLLAQAHTIAQDLALLLQRELS